MLTPLGAHSSWLLWGRSRLASFLRSHQSIGPRAVRRADVPPSHAFFASVLPVITHTLMPLAILAHVCAPRFPAASSAPPTHRVELAVGERGRL